MASEDRVALCVARFYDELADALEASARETLAAAGFEQIDTYAVPGAFELPFACHAAADSGRYEALVALGVVIRGETDHYDYVCSEAARGIQQVQLQTSVPIGFGLVTVSNRDQAWARVRGGDKRDTGAHAAQAALTSLAIKRELGQRPRPTGFAAAAD